jgi:hypothetical protein
VIQVFQKAQATGGMPWCDESIGWVYGLMREGRKARAVLQSSLAGVNLSSAIPATTQWPRRLQDQPNGVKMSVAKTKAVIIRIKLLTP